MFSFLNIEHSFVKLLLTFRNPLNLWSFSRFWAFVYHVIKWYWWYCTTTSSNLL